MKSYNVIDIDDEVRAEKDKMSLEKFEQEIGADSVIIIAKCGQTLLAEVNADGNTVINMLCNLFDKNEPLLSLFEQAVHFSRREYEKNK